MSSIREGIVADLLATVAQLDGINGAIDDVPPLDPRQVPRPAPGYGKAARPFGYVFEGPERAAESIEYHGFYSCDLPVSVEVHYDYSTSGGEGLKQKGRRILSTLQRGLMVDPNRGLRALTTLEDLNTIEMTDADGIGVAVWQGRVQYLRAMTDPGHRDGTL